MYRAVMDCGSLAAKDGDAEGRLLIEGTANSMRPMRSGKVLMPEGFELYKRRNPEVSIPLKARHGKQDLHVYSTVGRVTSLHDGADRTIDFTAWMGGKEETELQRETRTLINQGALRTVSFGWDAPKSQIRQLSHRQAPEWLQQEMSEYRLPAVLAFYEYDFRELSVTDENPDDVGAVLRVAAEENGVVLSDPRIADLAEAVSGLRAELLGEIGKVAKQEFAAAAAAAAQEAQAAWSNHYAQILEHALGVPRTDFAELLLMADPEARCGHGAVEAEREVSAEPVAMPGLLERIRTWKHSKRT